MGETSGQIKSYIEQKRGALENNLSELEGKAKEALDWQAQMEKRPLTMLGLAVGTGVVIAVATGRGSSQQFRYSTAEMQARPAKTNSGKTRSQLRKLSDTLDTFTGALLGVATTKAREFLGGKVPGFQEQCDIVEGEKRSGTAAAA